MADTEFQRTLRLLEETGRLSGDSPQSNYGNDADLLQRVSTLLESQGHAVPETLIAQAAKNLDMQSLVGRPVVPLPVALPPRRFFFRSSSNKVATRIYWEETFKKIYTERLSLPNEGYLQTPLSDGHARALKKCLDLGAHPDQLMAYKSPDPECANTGSKPKPPLMWTVRPTLIRANMTERLVFTDVALFNFLVEHGADPHVSYDDAVWYINSHFFSGHKRISIPQMAARVLMPELLMVLNIREAKHRRLKDSLLWFALIAPLRAHPRIASEVQWTDWITRLEATVHWILANEAVNPLWHAKILREAVHQHHPHSEWLARWLPEHHAFALAAAG